MTLKKKKESFLEKVCEECHGAGTCCEPQVALLHGHVSLGTLPGHSRLSCPRWHCLSPAVWQCWLCPVAQVYLECCKSTPTQTHPQPVPRATSKDLNSLFFYKIVPAAPPATATATRASPGKHQGPWSHSTRIPSHLLPRTRWGQGCGCSCSHTP